VTVRRADTELAEKLAASGAQLVEVLPPDEFQTEHLPGAVNLPLTEFTEEATAALDRGAPVIVYCFDTQCDLSSRGAALLETYGFRDVYDYTGSKAAWLAMGLGAEGDRSPDVRAGAVSRPAVTCPPDTPLEKLPDPGPGGVVVVTNGEGVVLGTIRGPARARTGRALDVLQPGPSTVRPSITIYELARSMDSSGETHILVTTFDGRLIGVIERQDLDVDR
jgi:rhodanese-related sulfurtransferase